MYFTTNVNPNQSYIIKYNFLLYEYIINILFRCDEKMKKKKEKNQSVE